jgi:phage host-nuclease inhibitor protein Gam
MSITKRIRLTRPVVATRAAAETMLGEIAAASARHAGLVAELEAELTQARQSYEGEIDALARDIELKTGLLQQWAESSPEEFQEGKKSVDMLHGRVGFRTGTPKFKTLAGWTFERVKDACKTDGLGENYVRIKESLDKEALLGAFASGALTDAQLRAVGCRVVQDESFFVEPKSEEVASSG